MIYITGDTHGIIDIGKIKTFLSTTHVTKDDYLIILGDVCCPRFKHELPYCEAFRFWENVPMTVLFIDGNHENFGQLNKLPVEMWNGGKVHKLSDNLIHLMRGQVFNIEGKTFFTMGGAVSIDKANRTPYVDWFEEEDCSYAETNEALDNLKLVNNKVDYVLTHCIGKEFMVRRMSDKMLMYPYAFGSINNFLDYINDVVEYKKWYFGHYHLDISYENENKECLYNLIKKIE